MLCACLQTQSMYVLTCTGCKALWQSSCREGAASPSAVQCYQIVLEQVKGVLQDRMSFIFKCTPKLSQDVPEEYCCTVLISLDR